MDVVIDYTKNLREGDVVVPLVPHPQEPYRVVSIDREAKTFTVEPVVDDVDVMDRVQPLHGMTKRWLRDGEAA